MEMHAPIRGTALVLAFVFSMCLLPAATAHAQGKWMVRDDLFSMSFPTETDGWACGRFGTILHSSDGGATWSPQTSGTTYTLSGICFADSKNGWAVGNKGTIVHTSDGGKTWERQQSPVGYYHMDVTFLNPLRGFIVSERTHILATKDGGKTWEVQFADEDYILKSVSFCDGQHGWTVGEFGHTYYTEDGGENWEKQAGFYELDFDTGFLRGDDFLFDVVAIDPRTAWAVGIQGTVRKTVDGGKSWEKANVDVPSTQLYTIAFDRAGVLTISGNGFCVFSADSGATWQKARFEPTIEYGWIYDVHAVKPGQFVACGDEGAIYRKASGGNWKRVAY